MTNKKKLIEVALPLNAINKASARKKSIRHFRQPRLVLSWPEIIRLVSEEKRQVPVQKNLYALD